MAWRCIPYHPNLPVGIRSEKWSQCWNALNLHCFQSPKCRRTLSSYHLIYYLSKHCEHELLVFYGVFNSAWYSLSTWCSLSDWMLEGGATLGLAGRYHGIVPSGSCLCFHLRTLTLSQRFSLHESYICNSFIWLKCLLSLSSSLSCHLWLQRNDGLNAKLIPQTNICDVTSPKQIILPNLETF